MRRLMVLGRAARDPIVVFRRDGSVGAGWELGEVPVNPKLQLPVVCAGGSVRGHKNIAVIVPQCHLVAHRRAQRREFNDN